MSANVAVVIGAKGGAGATTLCVDAISRLSKNADVALVDGDLVARRAIAVLLDKVRALDGARTTPNIASIEDGRLTIVELTATFDGGFTIKPPDVLALAEDLVARKSVVVVDAPQPFAAAVRPFVSLGRRFILVVEPSVLGLTSARVAQLEFERFGIRQRAARRRSRHARSAQRAAARTGGIGARNQSLGRDSTERRSPLRARARSLRGAVRDAVTAHR